jgi:hypothetical protein
MLRGITAGLPLRCLGCDIFWNEAGMPSIFAGANVN